MDGLGHTRFPSFHLLLTLMLPLSPNLPGGMGWVYSTSFVLVLCLPRTVLHREWDIGGRLVPARLLLNIAGCFRLRFRLNWRASCVGTALGCCHAPFTPRACLFVSFV